MLLFKFILLRRLTVKFLRTKFLENLGKDSLEPGRKQRFKEIVHEVFLSFSPKQQGRCLYMCTLQMLRDGGSRDGGGGYSTSLYRGRLCPETEPLLTIFSRV